MDFVLPKGSTSRLGVFTFPRYSGRFDKDFAVEERELGIIRDVHPDGAEAAFVFESEDIFSFQGEKVANIAKFYFFLGLVDAGCKTKTELGTRMRLELRGRLYPRGPSSTRDRTFWTFRYEFNKILSNENSIYHKGS